MKQIVLNWWCVFRFCLEGLTVLLKQALGMEPSHHSHKHHHKHINKDADLNHRKKHHGAHIKTRSRQASEEDESARFASIGSSG